MDIDGRKEIAVEAAEKAGKLLRDNFGGQLIVKIKKDGSLVTNIDLEAEKEIIGLIRKKYPQDSILSEETPVLKDSEFTWIIDPLDGTHNYYRSIEIFGTSIAVEFKKEVICGVIYIPLTKELYIAQKGRGSYMDNRRIKVSDRSLTQATMVYDGRMKSGSALASLGVIASKVFNIRMFGSSARALSYLAEGKVDLEIEHHDKVWDFAAGLLLIEEAGGKATNFKGGRWDTDTTAYIASNGKVHEEILEIVGK